MLVVCVGCAALTAAQRRLSTPVRRLRRHVTEVRGELVLDDGTVEPIDASVLRSAPEAALRITLGGDGRARGGSGGGPLAVTYLSDA